VGKLTQNIVVLATIKVNRKELRNILTTSKQVCQRKEQERKEKFQQLELLKVMLSIFFPILNNHSMTSSP